MQYIRGLEHYDNARKTAVTFGKFDGLHKGHMTLVDTVKKLQDKDDVDSVVCAFDMDSPALLMLPQERRFIWRMRWIIWSTVHLQMKSVR